MKKITKKGKGKKKKQTGLPDKFWTLMPSPGTFDWRTRTWLSTDPNRTIAEADPNVTNWISARRYQ